MYNNRILNVSLAVSLLFAPCMPALATETTSNALTFKDIFNLQAQSYNIIEEKSEKPADDKKVTALTIKPLSDNQKRTLTYNALAQHSAHKADSAVFADKNFYKKMDILHGEASSSSLFSLIDRTHTIFGQATLARMLCQMTNDAQELQKRQVIIQKLISDEEFFNYVDNSIKKIKSVEAQFLSYWEEEDPAHAELYNQVFYTTNTLKPLNKSTTGLEVKTRLGNALTVAGVLTRPLGYILGGIVGNMSARWFLNKNNAHHEAILNTPNASIYDKEYSAGMIRNNNQALLVIPKTAAESIRASCNGIKNGAISAKDFFFNGDASSKVKCLVGTALTAYLSWELYKAYGHYKAASLKNNTANQLQTRLIDVATYTRELENLYATLERTNVAITGIEQLACIVKPSDAHSADFNDLVGKLNCNTFTPEASFFSVTGRVLSAHTVMQEVKHEFIPAMEIAGEIDAYLSMAKLYKEFAAKRVHISFAQFIEQDTPYLQATNFWNPFVNPEYVVTNDITLGAQGLPNNVILTGPNTGGKSTVIKGLILNVLLAQTFGMAWADELVMTPFANVNCYLNITDDISAGTSLFKAEVLRAKDLINAVRDLKGKDFSFTIMDEIFSGTSPKEGEEAAYRFMEDIGTFNNSMVILATHFPMITELPDKKPTQFKNYRVAVDRDANGKIVRHYKLEEGKTFMNIAMDLLKEEGIFLN